MSLRERDVRLLLDSVARLYDPPSGDFIRHAPSVVRDLVPGETRAYHEVDVGTRALSFIDDPPGVFGSPAMLRDIVERTFPDHPIVGHYVRNPGELRILAVSDLVGRRTLQRLGI